MATAQPDDPGDDARLALDLVRDAGALAQRMRREGTAGARDLGVETKTSISDVVTAADRAAERLVVTRLAELRPDDGVLGEEGTSRSGTSGRTWVIDPVDGTYNFVRGLDWWCSAVALEVDGQPLLGAVAHPATGASYVGGVGLGARRGDVALAPLVDRALGESCVATYLHPPFDDAGVAAAFARYAGRAATLRMLGSGTLDAMAVAQGHLDVVCQPSVPPWDWMPGAAIIRAVGGVAHHVEAAGRTWYVAGVPTAVAEVGVALRDR